MKLLVHLGELALDPSRGVPLYVVLAILGAGSIFIWLQRRKAHRDKKEKTSLN